MTFISDLRRFTLIAGALLLTACSSVHPEWKSQDMTIPSSRIQPMFDKTKTVCFGRFLIDVPASATVAWGESQLPWRISIYEAGVQIINKMAEEKIAAFKEEHNIRHKKPSFISAIPVTNPPGQLVTGYESYSALDDVKIAGYFSIGTLGVFIDSGDFLDQPRGNASKVIDIAKRMRPRSAEEIPAEPGNCIDHAFIADSAEKNDESAIEHIRIGFRLKEFPDTHISIYMAPSNKSRDESNGLESRLNRYEKRLKAQDPNNPQVATRYMRRGNRKINDLLVGFEALSRTVAEEDVHSTHVFILDSSGTPSDPFKPRADIRLQTGVADDMAGAVEPTLTDEEAVAVWDKIISTIRVRKATDASLKESNAVIPERTPLGELVATGRICPQTGWWQCVDEGKIVGGRRQHFHTGEMMPPVVLLGSPTIWQKIKGEYPRHQIGSVWKLVDYDMPLSRPDVSNAVNIEDGINSPSSDHPGDMPSDDSKA